MSFVLLHKNIFLRSKSTEKCFKINPEMFQNQPINVSKSTEKCFKINLRAASAPPVCVSSLPLVHLGFSSPDVKKWNLKFLMFESSPSPPSPFLWLQTPLDLMGGKNVSRVEEELFKEYNQTYLEVGGRKRKKIKGETKPKSMKSVLHRGSHPSIKVVREAKACVC